MDESYDAVVLAGGAARRLGGGTDKPALRIGGTSLLDRVLAGCAGARTVVVVGPERPTALPVRWVREQPPGGGPVAALAAALPELRTEVCLLLAADLPFFDAATARRLVAELTAARPDGGFGGGFGGGSDGAPGSPPLDAVVLVDPDGREQPLAAAYRVGPLRAALAALLGGGAGDGAGGDPSGLPLRRLVGGLATGRLPDPAGASADCDTWADVEQARARAQRESTERERMQPPG